MNTSNSSDRRLTEEERDALQPERRGVEEAIQAEPATDLRDFAIKVLVNSGEGCFALSNALTLECAALADRDFDRLPRCLFEDNTSR